MPKRDWPIFSGTTINLPADNDSGISDLGEGRAAKQDLGVLSFMDYIRVDQRSFQGV